jgi:hypothetical protein
LITLGLLAGLAYLLPLAAFVGSGRSVFLAFWEFACYRYYGALSLVHHDFDAVWVVQGFPMAILQSWLARYLIDYSPHALGSVAQIDLFATATISCAYGIGCVALVIWWVIPRVSVASKTTLTGVTLLIWPPLLPLFICTRLLDLRNPAVLWRHRVGAWVAD